MRIFTQLKAGIHSCFYIAPTCPDIISLDDELKGTSSVLRSICHISRQSSLLYILPCQLSIGEKLYNSAVVVENGKLIGTTDMTHSSEDRYALSSVFCVHQTRYGKIGILIDEDVSYFECGRILSLMGAEILLCLGGSRRMAYAQSVSNGVIGIYSHLGKVLSYNAIYRKIDNGIRITSMYPLHSYALCRRPYLYSILSSDTVDEVRNMSVYSPNDFVK